MQFVHQLSVCQLAGAGAVGVLGAEIPSQPRSWPRDSAGTAAGTEMKWKRQQDLLRQERGGSSTGL